MLGFRDSGLQGFRAVGVEGIRFYDLGAFGLWAGFPPLPAPHGLALASCRRKKSQRVPHTLPLWNLVPKTKIGMVFLGPNSIGSVCGPSGNVKGSLEFRAYGQGLGSKP